jgi:MGT family glycosyltransferase
MSRRSTFLFKPGNGFGPVNNSVGIADVLRRRGHRIVFVVERSWAGRLERVGFEEELLDMSPPESASGEASVSPGPTPMSGRDWKEFYRDTVPLFPLRPIEQLDRFVRPAWQALIDGVQYCEGALKEIVDRQRPDVVIEDNAISFPALVTAGAPFVRIVTCNPLEMKGPAVPPTFSGLPSDDPSGWSEFRSEYDRTHRPTWEAFNDWVVSADAPPLPDLEFIHESLDLNLYVFPELLDYTDVRPLAPTWHRLDSSVRATDVQFELPESLRRREGKLIYLSLGSLGSSDLDLMRRLVDVLSRSPHRFIVSKGPRHHEFELPDRMYGAHQVPQTNVIPLVDLVITHGGNNTVTECFHFGKPMIVLPLFWDQHDNAQRIHETGYGRKLSTYEFADEELLRAIEELLADGPLGERMAAAGEQVRSRRGTLRAANLIEQLALDR